MNASGRKPPVRNGWLVVAMVLLAVGLQLAGTGPVAAQPVEGQVTGDKPFACQSRPQYEGLWGFQKDGLVEALGKGLAFASISGACVMLDAGETVTVLPGNPQSDFTQVRRQGSDKLWWIARQRLK